MRFAPPCLQLGLLVFVARNGSLEDVGTLALGSAVSFLCGALAEAGFSTSLSIPRMAFGVSAPPLRSTARLRLAAAVAGSCLYALLWAAGLGHHDPTLLIVTPLPLVLALAVGYAGAMNASGLLRFEGLVSVGESGLVLVLAVLGSIVVSALPAALAALTIGRAVGAATRALLLRSLPQSDEALPRSAAHLQLGFFLVTAATVFQGQADMLAIGFSGSLIIAAIYGPLMRTAASALLGTESLTWALYGAAHPDETGEPGWFGRHWRELTLGMSTVAAVVFALFAEPFVRFVVDRSLPDLRDPVLLLAVTMIVRAASLVLNVSIVRAGRQREEAPIVAAAGIGLAVGAVLAAHAGSLTGLAAARLGSEALIAVGFLLLWRRPPLRARPVDPAEVRASVEVS